MQKLLFFLTLGICATSIANAQNIGIGTESPVEKLEVAGNIKADTLKPKTIKITTNAGVGKLLTSDAAGNASWQESTTAKNANGIVGFGSWGDCSMSGISEYNPVTDTAAAAGDLFGLSVAQSGDFAFVGVPSADNGCADVYQFDGGNWIFRQKLIDPTGRPGDIFGISVAVSGNFAVVGAAFDSVGENPLQGSASIFRYNGSSWVFMQKLTDPSGTTGDFFGASVSISGNNIIIAAISDDVGANADQGSALIFHYNGSNWGFVQKIVDATGAAGYAAGSVSISGNFAVVGSGSSQVGDNLRQGAVNIYRLNGSNWVFMKKIIDSTGTTDDAFGNNVSISGNYIIAGAYGVKVGDIPFAGAAFIFHLENNDWVLMQKLTDPTSEEQNFFGGNVFISGNYAMIGEQYHGTNGIRRGSAVLYSRVGLQWQQLQYITDPQGQVNDMFGSAVAVDGTTKRFLISASGYAKSSGKAVFGKF